MSFDVHGLGNFPGKAFGRPLLAWFLASLSTTWAPKETVLFRLVVPGVMRMPFGLVGDIPGAEGNAIAFISSCERVGISTATVRGFESTSIDCLMIVSCI